MFSFSSFIYVRNTNHIVAVSCSKVYSYKVDTHFSDELLVADRKGEEPLLLYYFGI